MVEVGCDRVSRAMSSYVHSQRVILRFPTTELEMGNSTLQVFDFNMRASDGDPPRCNVVDYSTQVVMPNIFLT